MKNGGSAFPVLEANKVNMDYECTDPGMTLHQYYIGQALTSFKHSHLVDEIDPVKIARLSCDIADAVMDVLAEREKQR